MDTFLSYMVPTSKFMLLFLSLLILGRCLRSMLRERYEPETWAYIRWQHETLPVHHWEAVIGRSRSADVRVVNKGVGRAHAVLTRDDRGNWTVYDVFFRNGIWINGVQVGTDGAAVSNGDVMNLNGSCVRFLDLSQAPRAPPQPTAARPLPHLTAATTAAASVPPGPTRSSRTTPSSASAWPPPPARCATAWSAL